MRHVLISLMVAAALASVVGCKKDEPTTKASGHAPLNAKPGSHEDWCDEHAVPESQCTLCNASLIPAFKATADWCEDHKLPKSQDRKCNPNLKIVRPPKS